jgi:WD repeat-containing protein 23
LYADVCHCEKLATKCSAALYESSIESNARYSGNDSRTSRLTGLTPQHFSILVGRASRIWRTFGAGVRQDEEEDADDEEEYLDGTYRRSQQWFPPVTDPQQAGLDLMMSGQFGRVGRKTCSRHRQGNIAKLIHHPPTRFRTAAYIEDMVSVSTFLSVSYD